MRSLPQNTANPTLVEPGHELFVSRVPTGRPCSMVFNEQLDDESIAICEEQALIMNATPKGVLLLTARRPEPNTIIEIHVTDVDEAAMVALLEVCWTVPSLPDEAQSQKKYLVEANLLFGPFFYPCATLSLTDGSVLPHA
ncbi:MAG: hypothetical protein ACREI3_09345 [Nitrospirales bacterium]